jgi:hypothetical protein
MWTNQAPNGAAGTDNTVQSNVQHAVIGGGARNSIGHGTIGNAAVFGTIGGGFFNTIASNIYAGTIPDGSLNSVAGHYGFAAGQRAQVNHDGTFVWADFSTDTGRFESTSNNQFLIRAVAGVGINTNNPGGYDLNVRGSARVSGLSRAGLESGTSQTPEFDVPGYSGVITRRIRSTSAAGGQVVALTDTCALERDGAGGFLFRHSALVNHLTITAMGMNSSGASVNFYFDASNPQPAGTVTFFPAAQNIVSFQCNFGDPYDNSHTTHVNLFRVAGDSYWAGTVTSTFNQ